MNQITLSALKEILSSPKKIVITTHRNPDGDAIGSSLGLYHFLKNKGQDVQVIVPNNYATFLHFLPEDDSVIIYEEAEELANKLVNEAELVFLLDFNALYRLEKLGKVIENCNAMRILIDHHLDPEIDDLAFQVWDNNASSAAELVYDFIELLGEQIYLDYKVAFCIYAGIVSDTARFKFNTTAKLHRITAHLLEQNIDATAIHGQIFDNVSEDKMRFLGFCLTERMQVFRKHNTAIIYLTIADFERFDLKKGYTEGLVNYPLSLEGIRFAALIKQQGEGEIVKLSLRSKGDFSVNDFSRQHFGGGGHKNAAGGYSNLNLTETLDKFTNLLPLYADYLCSEEVAIVKEEN